MPSTLTKLDRIDRTVLASNRRASLSSWQKYEPIVLAAFRLHPKPYIFHPSNMAARTVESRIRDAVRGKIAFDYPSELSTPDLERWWSQAVVKSDDKQVFIGPPQELQATLSGTATTSTRPADLVFDDLTFEEVSAFALLISSRRVPGPVLVKSPPDITLLPPRPNVELMQRPDGSLVIL